MYHYGTVMYANIVDMSKITLSYLHTDLKKVSATNLLLFLLAKWQEMMLGLSQSVKY